MSKDLILSAKSYSLACEPSGLMNSLFDECADRTEPCIDPVSAMMIGCDVQN